MTDSHMGDELKGRLEHLSTRGEPRGAGPVLEAAQSRATVPPPSALRRAMPPIAIAAAISLVAGISGALVFDDGNGQSIAIRPVDTVPTPTTEAPLVEVSIPSRLIAQSRLVPFSNCDAYTTHARNQGLAKVTPYGLPGMGGMGGGDVAFATGAPVAADSAGAAESRNSAAPPQALAATDDGFSTTNVQEAGIDEPDVVKTDGRRIYALSNERLYVVDAAALKVLGSVSVGAARDLFVTGNRALVFGGVAGGGGQPMPMEGRAIASDMAIAPYAQKLRITVVDVSDPAAMREVSHMDVDGTYVSARLVDGIARIVVSSQPSRLAFTYPQGQGGPAEQAAALERNKQVIRDAKFESWVPHYTVTDGAGRPGSDQPLVDCDASYRPPEFSGFGNLSVLSLDPQKPDAVKTTSVMADGQIVYASPTRLYVSTYQWGDVEPMANTIAPPSSPKTLVHSFDITDKAQAKYLLSGTVRGTALNQFSMSEHEGRLRIATTDQGNGQNSESFVSVLAPSDKSLVQVGQVGGLGKGEQIHSVRFVGPVGYVVTFRQTDPLYVINLDDATKPRVVGELKILGYSAYLHPVGDGLLLGVGQDATEEGRRLGSQVSLFDVSNPAAPKRLQQHSLGGQGSSQVEFDHHAFLYWAPKKLAVVPVQTYDQAAMEQGKPAQSFMGAVGMTVNRDAIKEVGRVSNPNGMVERSLVIGDRLFTYSASGIKASSLDSFAEQGWMPFS